MRVKFLSCVYEGRIDGLYVLGFTDYYFDIIGRVIA